MSSYARWQDADSKQTTGQINLRPMRVTRTVLFEVFEEASTTYEFLVSEAPS